MNHCKPTPTRPTSVGNKTLAFLEPNPFILGIAGLLTVFFWANDAVFSSPIQDNPLDGTQTVAPKIDAPQTPTPSPQTPQNKTAKKELPIPAPSDLILDTSDGVSLHCTYFGAAQDPELGSGKKTIPFILLHDWDGDRRDLLPFALYLQKFGCAVIVPDLRGHGDSTTIAGSTTKLDYLKFRKLELEAVVKDIERCKKYLVQRNNESELNIDLLNVVAVGQTSVLAMNWTIADWFAFPPVSGGIKQGQDVKSLTLISPRKKLDGLSMSLDLKHPLFAGKNTPNLPTLIVWSANDVEAEKEGRSIYEAMKKGRPDLEQYKDDAERVKNTTLFNGIMPGIAATGTELIRDQPDVRLWPYIAKFVAVQVGVKAVDYPWQSRIKQ